jgi:rod shape-determining protein MreB and related proteins
MFHRFRQWLSPDLAVDLGTANTVIAIPGEGVILDEPSVVAVQAGTRKILGRGAAIGKLARQMLGRTPESISAAQPVRDGVITDFELCEAMLRYFFDKIDRRSPGFRPRVVIAVPGGITPVERRAVFNSAERAGSGKVYTIEAAKAAAIGAGLPLAEPLASLVCEIGAGTTEIAIFSLGEMVAWQSIRTAGDACDTAIVDFVRQNYSLRIGAATACQIKHSIGSGYLLRQELTTEVRGLDIISGIPRKVMMTSEEIREALRPPLRTIVGGVKQVIEQCTPELVADLAETGLMLAGGGALLRGLADLFEEQLGIPARIAPNPQHTVALGVAICAEHLSQWRNSLQTIDG